jgi:sugar-specific transcriptional regulator TrmB
MNDYGKLKDLGFSHYEISCYIALMSKYPANGSQISRASGIARSRIYDVLRNLTEKGMVMEAGNGMFVPLPPDELIKRLKNRFVTGIKELKTQLEFISQETSYEFIWSIKGYDRVIAKAREMIAAADKEIYARLYPKAFHALEIDLKKAEQRGVGIRYVAMGKSIPLIFEIQVSHPGAEQRVQKMGGQSFDLICDAKEALVGMFETGKEKISPVNWTKNRWLIITNRDRLRHDFYRCFLEKIHDRGLPLSHREEKIYTLIKSEEIPRKNRVRRYDLAEV